MRFWYRAIDPAYAENEASIFGGASEKEGQARFLLRVAKKPKSVKWDRDRYDCFNALHPKYKSRPDHASGDNKTWQLNGVRYLGFSLFMGDNKNRQAIPAGKEFTLELLFKNRPDNVVRQRILASLWLLGHFGSLGTRSRRGFGVVSLQSLVATKGNEWPEITMLPLAACAMNTDDWQETYETSMKTLKLEWFKGSQKNDHIVFGSHTKIRLFDTKVTNSCKNKDMKPWEYALDTAGKTMQKYRQRWNLADINSDYFRVKQHLYLKHPEIPAIPGLTKANLTNAPKRTAFGLPLAFRYSSLEYQVPRGDGGTYSFTPNALFEGAEEGRGRSASRILVRVAEIGETAYPVFIRMDGPLLKRGDEISLKNNKNKYPQPSDTILEEFWKTIPKIKEIHWGAIK